MGSTKRAANLFRATQTEDKLHREGTKGTRAANLAHYAVGTKARQTTPDIGGVMPERLLVAEDVDKVEKRRQNALKTIARSLIDDSWKRRTLLEGAVLRFLFVP